MSVTGRVRRHPIVTVRRSGGRSMNAPAEPQMPPIASAIELFDTPSRPGQGMSLRAQLPAVSAFSRRNPAHDDCVGRRCSHSG